MNITPLYKLPIWFELFEYIYAMEKIQGTSTWIIYHINEELEYYSGDESIENFKALFDDEFLTLTLSNISKQKKCSCICIHGECYGGKHKGMASTYGNQLKFIVFDVLMIIDGQENFLNVPDAETIARQLNLEFVHYAIIVNNPVMIKKWANKMSTQARRNNMGYDKDQAGIILRPLVESQLPDGTRAIAKQKNERFVK